MAPSPPELTLGVEEEYQIIDPVTRQLHGQAEAVLTAARETLGEAVQPELHRSQVEIATPVCQNLADVRAKLTYCRQAVIAAAETAGCQIAAAGTHPFSHWADQEVTPKPRYQELVNDYQQLMREQVIFGCHVHVGISDRELAIQIMNRARVWLTPLLALTANSPFWLGRDTGYASFRTELWGRWPTSGPPATFQSYADYRAVVQSLVDTHTVRDGSKIYWDIRVSERFETLEFRVTDVCATVDEAVMVAGLIQALVQTCYTQIVQGKPEPLVRSELLYAAHWRAARHGLSGELLDVIAEQAVPAAQRIETFLDFLRPALEEQNTWEEVSQTVRRIQQQGTGSDRQRAIYQQTGRLEDVVDHIVRQTSRDVPKPQVKLAESAGGMKLES